MYARAFWIDRNRPDSVQSLYIEQNKCECTKKMRKTAMQKQKHTTVQTALDDLPYGPIDSPDATGPVRKAVAPEGVSHKRMLKDVTLIAWPSFVELVLTQLTSMADQVMVGQMPGAEGVMGLTAVGLASMPKFLLMTMVIAMNVGTTAVVARSRGQQDQKKANQVFRQALLLNIVMSVALMVVGLLSSEWLIRFMSASGIAEQTLQYGVTYLNIQLYGFIPLCLASTVTAALRGVGDTKTPMIYNTVANVVNIIFNYALIYGHFGFPAMGVAGASLATIIGQGVAFVIAMCVALGKKHYLFVDLREKFTFDKRIMKDVTSIGLPSMIEQLIMRAGIIVFLRTVASLGDTMYATHQIVMNIQSMSFMVGQAFGNSSTTLMGQSLGKRRYDMAALYMHKTRQVGFWVSVVLMALMAIFNRQLIMLYNSTPEVVAMGAGLMFVVALMQPIQCGQFIVSGGLRGVGDTRYNAMVVLITTLGVRAILSVLFVYGFKWGLWGAWIALFADQALRSVLILRRYRSGSWKAQLAKRTAHEAAKA